MEAHLRPYYKVFLGNVHVATFYNFVTAERCIENYTKDGGFIGDLQVWRFSPDRVIHYPHGKHINPTKGE